MKIACLTPLPPVRSGIASYSAMLLPALAEKVQLTAVVDQESFAEMRGIDVIQYREFCERRSEFGAVLAQMGNNPHHEFIYRDAMANPSTIVLHDLVLHHLIVEMTLARGDGEGYVAELEENHQRWGSALARSRVAGYHLELGNFLFPASIRLAKKARAVIVHNRYALEALRAHGVATPAHLVSHAHSFSRMASVTDAARKRRDLGFAAADRIIGMFGFVTSAKRPETVFESFSAALRRDERLRLLVVGEPAPNVDLDDLARRHSIPADHWRSTGFVSDEEFERLLASVDAVVNLRYPTAGETSGALIHILAAGKPVAVNDYAQFAEYPEGVVSRIPFGEREVDRLAEFMMDESSSSPAARERRVEWIRKAASLEHAVAGYLAALRPIAMPASAPVLPRTALPVLPDITLASIDVDTSGTVARASLSLRNEGTSPLRGIDYGAPEYRVVAKVFDSTGLLLDRWLTPDGDLEPGVSRKVVLSFRPGKGRHRFELIHGIEGVPIVDERPFAYGELEL